VSRRPDSWGGLAELRDRVPPEVDRVLLHSADQGFLGAMPVADQIDHALGFVFAAESVVARPPTSFVDLGTGGGVPGVVLLACWPECRAVLLDANERRSEFLDLETAGWRRSGTLEVVRGRAEEVAREPAFRQQFELVTSRSFGPPPVTAECGAPLLAVGGLLVVSEPPEGPGADRWPLEGLAEVGLAEAAHIRFEDRFGYRVLRKVAPTSDRYPRRVGVPAKRPLF
jgi:16S rRNA (guanine527-N7)-methyltransferase